MITIDNIHTTHYSALRDLIDHGDSLLIASPYLMSNMDDVFNNLFASNLKEIHLITTMKDDDLDLLKKADAIHSLLVNCLKHNIECNIRINNKLHGKVYLAIKNGQVNQGIVTSANFTTSGLLRNHEWGINHSDLKQLEEIKSNLITHASEIVSEAELISIIERIDENKEKLKYFNDKAFDLKISDLINKEERLNRDLSKKRFFLKPVGWSENHYSINERMPDDIAKLHFSKRRPAAVREGDILICYAVGTAKLLGYFEAIERPYHLGHEGRWLWEVKAQNLNPSYSNHWVRYNHTISSIQESFKDSSKEPITKVGGHSLGALNFEADRIQLSQEFAEHVIGLINGVS